METPLDLAQRVIKNVTKTTFVCVPLDFLQALQESGLKYSKAQYQTSIIGRPLATDCESYSEAVFECESGGVKIGQRMEAKDIRVEWFVYVYNTAIVHADIVEVSRSQFKKNPKRCIKKLIEGLTP